ncbi:MAG: amidohydrolase, partial [Ferrimicrobium sp.]
MEAAHPKLIELADAIERLPLVDHHCHSFFATKLEPHEVEHHLTGAPDTRAARTITFDASLGLSVLRTAGPALGQTPPVTSHAYLKARSQRSAEDLTTLFLTQAGISDLLVDTGYQPDALFALDELARLSGARVHEILRLETTAERLLTESSSPEAFLDRWPRALEDRSARVVGLKSIAAYRCGPALDPVPPSRSEVLFTLGHELAKPRLRLTDPTVISYLATSAIEVTRLPLQLHVGISDPDVRLGAGHPGLLQGFIEFANELEVPICLLHCYPFHREAALLAHDYPNVFLDLGLALNFVGPRASH